MHICTCPIEEKQIVNWKREKKYPLTLDHPKKLFSFFISIRSFSASGSVSKKRRHSLVTRCTRSAGRPVSLR